jgi:hypothetical protein
MARTLHELLDAGPLCGIARAQAEAFPGNPRRASLPRLPLLPPAGPTRLAPPLRFATKYRRGIGLRE